MVAEHAIAGSRESDSSYLLHSEGTVVYINPSGKAQMETPKVEFIDVGETSELLHTDRTRIYN